MDTSNHDLSALFQQLGLGHSSQEINQFISTHQLPAGVALAQAHFWTPAQAAFIKEALLQDSDWAEITDKLAARLTAVVQH